MSWKFNAAEAYQSAATRSRRICVQNPFHALFRNMLAKGNPEFCAILVAVNSVLQIVLYAPFALFYLQVSIMLCETF